MKRIAKHNIFSIIVVLNFVFGAAGAGAATLNQGKGQGMESSSGSKSESNSKSFYDLSIKTINGEQMALKAWAGKVTLVVNVASKCGYTNQYKGLEALFQKYKDKGLVIVGFPSNDFGQQEPGSDGDIKKFCELNFGVTFPLATKGPVTGSERQPIFDYLVTSFKGEPKGEVAWNFEKFLVDKNGQVISRFKSKVKPDDAVLVEAIESALGLAK